MIRGHHLIDLLSGVADVCVVIVLLSSIAIMMGLC